MQKHFGRTLMIYLVLLVAGVYIYPTIGWMTLSDETRQARLASWHEEDEAVGETTFWGDVAHKVKRWSQFDRSMVINLGLDLQGGVHMVVGFDMNEEAANRDLDEAQIQEMILQRIRNRIDEFEAQEPLIQKLGTNQVQVQLPGEKDIQRAKNLIMRTAFLTFHMAAGPEETNRILRTVDQHFNNGFVPLLDPPTVRGGPYQIRPENYDRILSKIEEANSTEGLLPENRSFALSTPPKPGEERGYLLYLLEEPEAMTGEHLASAAAGPDNMHPGQWMIRFAFDGEGSQQFADLTEANTGRSMAILLDNRVVSAPNIKERIFGEGNISGSFTAEEARDLAIALNSGSMPVPIHEDYTGVVGASLGADSVTSGIRSSIIGLIAVMIFMIAYYRVSGLVANVALLANAACIIGAMAYFGSTLTLPGIAGLVLTIGMAVDANVLIFERIREELRNGKSVVSAVESGFSRATVTILDANITTLIAAAVLTQFGTGPVQGFAITLSIGVCASVFAALIVSRAIFDFAVNAKLVSKLTMTSIVPSDSNFRFLDYRRMAVIASVSVIVMSLAVFGLRGQKNFGVDFTTGTNMEIAINADAPIQVGDVREKLNAAGFVSPTVQEFQREGGEQDFNNFVIRVNETAEALEGSSATSDGTPPVTVDRRVQDALLSLAGNPSDADINSQVELLSVETVGPAVGKKLQRDAVAAVMYALFFIVVYLWFRFELKFAVGAVVALAHDVIITLGFFALFQREITIPVVAAILTIIGYSLNDTIIVFDRIREDIKLYKGRGYSLAKIMDLSINQTLSRTLLTSGTTLFVVVVLYIFGGDAINDFAFALLVGIVVGTYSSIYVASPVVLMWEKIRGRMMVDDSDHTGDKPLAPGGKKGKKRGEKPAAV